MPVNASKFRSALDHNNYTYVLRIRESERVFVSFWCSRSESHTWNDVDNEKIHLIFPLFHKFCWLRTWMHNKVFWKIKSVRRGKMLGVLGFKTAIGRCSSKYKRRHKQSQRFSDSFPFSRNDQRLPSTVIDFATLCILLNFLIFSPVVYSVN